MVWSIIGWTLLGLLALFLLVLLVPSVAYLDYRGGEATVKLRVLFLKLTLYPFKAEAPEAKTRKKRKNKKKPPAEEKKAEKQAPEDSLEDRLDFIRRVIDTAKASLGFLLRFVYISGFEFQAAVNTGDAYDTAILYGRLQGVVGAIRAGLENTFHIRFKRMVLIPDFGGQYPDSLIFSCKVSVPPVIMLVAGVKGLLRFLHWRQPKPQPARQPAPGAAATGPQRSDKHGE